MVGESASRVVATSDQSSQPLRGLRGSMHRWQLMDWQGETRFDRISLHRGRGAQRFQLSQLLDGSPDDLLQGTE